MLIVIFQNFIKKYDNVESVILEIKSKMQNAQMQIEKDIVMLDTFIEQNLKYIDDLDSYILAGTLKQKEALKEGSFKILSQDYYVFSYARFTDKQLILTVCSTDHEERILELPIKAFGKWECGAKEDLLKTPLSYEVKDGYLYLKVKPHTSYLIEV